LGRKCRTTKRETDLGTAGRAYRLYEGPVLSATRSVWRRGQEPYTRERQPVGGGVEEVWEELRVSHVPWRRARLLLLSQRGLSSRGGGRRLEEDVHVFREASWNSWTGELEDGHWNSRHSGSMRQRQGSDRSGHSGQSEAL